MCVKKKKQPFPKLTVKIQEAYKLHSLQVEWEEWKRGDRLARTANERMQSLPFSLIPAPFSPSPLLPHSTADLRARTRIHSHTNTNKLSQANFKARLNLFSSRQDDSRGHFSPSRSSSVRSKSYLFMFSLSRLLVLIFGVLWRLHCTCDFIEIISLEAKHLCFPFKVTFWNLSYVSFGRDSK